MRDVEAARTAPPVTLADFAGTQLSLRIGALMFEAEGGWIGMVLLNGTRDAAPLAAAVAARADKNIVFLDLKRESDALVASYRNEALQWAQMRGSRSGRVAWQFARDYAGRHAKKPAPQPPSRGRG